MRWPRPRHGWSIGSTLEEALSAAPLQRVRAQGRDFAVSCVEGRLCVVSNVCNHVGGPLGEGRLEGGSIVCPGTTGSSIAAPAAWRTGLRDRLRARVAGRTGRRPGVRQPRRREQTQQAAACSPSVSAADRARRPDRCGSPAFSTTAMGEAKPAPLRLRSSSRSRLARGGAARRRSAAHPRLDALQRSRT